jgi:hypothetical protein
MRYVVHEYAENVHTDFEFVSDVVSFLNERLDISAVDVIVLLDNEDKAVTRMTAHEFVELHSSA